MNRLSLYPFILCILWLLFIFPVCHGEKKAFIVGIGHYDTPSTGWTEISGNNDVELLGGNLKSRGFRVSVLKDSQATKKSIKKGLERMRQEINKGDTLYLHFSGHGQLIRDFNGDEPTGFDQAFICYDAVYSPHVKVGKNSYYAQNHLIDDEIFPFLNEMKLKLGPKGFLMVVFDSCFSGDAERNETQEEEPGEESEVEWKNVTRGTRDKFEITREAREYLSTLPKPGEFSVNGCTLTVISACDSTSKNYECQERHSGRSYGTLSYVIAKLIKSGVPMGEWAVYFQTGRYNVLKIFRNRQKPVVKTY